MTEDFDWFEPGAWAALCGQVADEELGPLKKPLAELVAQVSQGYNKERDALQRLSAPDMLQARLRFFMPRDLFKVHAPLRELAVAGGLPSGDTWRVLDLGAGLGTTCLGAAGIAQQHGARIRVTAVDRDARSLACLERMAQRLGVRVRTRTGDATDAVPDGEFDLILCGLFLNELRLAERRRLLDALVPRLAEGGSIVILEPALRGPTRELHALRDGLAESALSVFAPCLRTGPCPMLETERDWCHEDREFVLPTTLVPVAREAGLRFERSTYAYLTLRRDGLRLRDHLHGDGRVVSQALISKGKRELFVCRDDGRVRLTRLDRHRAEINADFDDASRGDVLQVIGARPKGPGERLDGATEVNREAPGSPSS